MLTDRPDKRTRLITWTLNTYDELTRDDVFDMFKLRQEVFVVEQACIYPDIDDIDKRAHHLFARDADGHLSAYLRLIPPMGHYNGPAIGRVVTAVHARGRGLGRELMGRGIRAAEHHFPAQPIHLSAQTYLRRFYTDLGFVTQGDAYDEDGIEHVHMVRG